MEGTLEQTAQIATILKDLSPENSTSLGQLLGCEEGKDLSETLGKISAAMKGKGEVKPLEGGFDAFVTSLDETLGKHFGAWGQKQDEFIKAANQLVVQQVEEAEEKDLKDATGVKGGEGIIKKINNAPLEEQIELLSIFNNRGEVLHKMYEDATPFARKMGLPTNDARTKLHQEFNDLCLILSSMGQDKRGRVKDFGQLIGQYKWLAPYAEKIGFTPPDKKGVAMDTATSGEGLEWVPDLFSSELIERFELEVVLAQLFPQFPMSTDNITFGQQTARPVSYRMTQALVNTDFFDQLATETSLGSDNIRFDAEKAAALIFYSDESNDDIIFNLVQNIRKGIIRALREGLETWILNGSSAGNDLDNANVGTLWTGVADMRSAGDGLRKFIASSGVTRVDAGGADPTTVLLRKVMAKMGKYGVYPEGLAWIWSKTGRIKLLDLQTGSGNDAVVTIDKFGPNATILKGQLASFDSIPLIISDFARDDYEADGYYDSAGLKNKTSAQLVWTDAVRIGTRRQITIETDRNIVAQQNAMIATWRGDVQKVVPATETTENELYNLPVD